MKNGSETDTDCGGSECSVCSNGQTCSLGGDCASGVCSGGVCVPWARALGGPEYDANSQALDVAFDARGNVIVTGEAAGPANLGDATHAVGAGAFDLFVSKLATDGTHLWSKLVGGPCNDYGRSVATDRSGNVLVGGSLGCGGSVGGPVLTGIEQALVAKYSATGEHLWSKAFGDDGADEAVMALETLSTGEIVIAGIFESTAIDFGLAAPLLNHGSSGSGDLFVAKLAPDGSTRWAKAFGGAGYDRVTALAVDPGAGQVVVTGTLGGFADFGGGTLAPVGQSMFVLKLSACGEHLWSKVFSGDAQSVISSHAVAIDRDGEVSLTGSYSGTLSFGGLTFTSVSDDVFLAKLSAGGALLWSKSFLGSGFDEGRALALDEAGAIWVAGAFNSSSLDLGGSELHNVSDFFGMDVFVAKYDATGRHLLSTSYPSRGDDRGLALAAHPTRPAILLGGMFTDALDIAVGTLPSAGSFDVFVANLGTIP
jgi:hypothetical protein